MKTEPTLALLARPVQRASMVTRQSRGLAGVTAQIVPPGSSRTTQQAQAAWIALLEDTVQITQQQGVIVLGTALKGCNVHGVPSLRR